MNIPITFVHANRTHTAHFSHVMGAGSSSHFHLYENNYFIGQLFYTETGWRFFSNKYPGLSDLADYFGLVVTSWGDAG